MTFVEEARAIAERARALVDDPNTPEDLRIRLLASLDQYDASLSALRALGDVARRNP